MYLCSASGIRRQNAPVNEHHKTAADLNEEQKLVEAAKADPAKFSLLYEKYYKVIFVFIFRRTGEEEVTADITSNTFLKAMLALPKYEYKGVPFSAFLFRIALNEINMYFRKSKKERVVSLGQANLGAMADETGQGDTEENRGLVLALLAHLDSEAMQLIEMRFFEKRPFAEIAGILGITENHAKVKTYRILDKLKALILKKRTGK